VGLERGPLSLASITEWLLGRNSSGSSLEKFDNMAAGIHSADHMTLYLQKSALTSATSGGRSVGMVRSRTKATDLVRA
jgi:hypothetical protein